MHFLAQVILNLHLSPNHQQNVRTGMNVVACREYIMSAGWLVHTGPDMLLVSLHNKYQHSTISYIRLAGNKSL